MRPEPRPSLTEAHAALAAGHPTLAAQGYRQCLPLWPDEARLGLAAALLRLGRTAEAREVLAGAPPDTRRAVLDARADWLDARPTALPGALDARRLARQEGDGPALVAAVTLLGELQLSAGDARTALRTLAEGLKVTELMHAPADAHLLAVLARVQAVVGSAAKARRTAEKALERSQPGSPARVAALLALDRPDEARAEAEHGELHTSHLR